jgi:hypothetical protein
MAEVYCVAGKKAINPETQVPDCTSPPPEVHLAVNGQEHVTVPVGGELCYQWHSSGGEQQEGVKFTSYWYSDNPKCSYGLNAGLWDARSASGGYCYPAQPEQAGCTYTIVYSGCGTGRKCSADSIGVTIKDPDQKK